MYDLISRQAAIEAIKTWGLIDGLSEGQAIEILEDEEKLPSAQLDRTEYILETKAIPSERDCVDLSEKVTVTFYDDEHEKWSHKTVTIRDVLDSVCDEYMIMPSEEPEIIRCRDCKHFEYDHPYVIQGVPVLGHLVCNRWGDGCKTDEDGFCFMGERREDERLD